MSLFTHKQSADPHDIDILARTIYGEARNQGVEGMEAVANVILNRVEQAHNHPHFGDGTIARACQYHEQFSCWNENDPNRAKLLAVTDADPVFKQCLQVASDACNGCITDNTDGATYYQVIGTNAPWSVGKTPSVVIKDHEFYKDIA